MENNNNGIMDLKNVNPRILLMITEYLDLKSLFMMQLTCKYFQNFFSKKKNFEHQLCYQQFFPEEIDYFCDYGDVKQFIQIKKKKDIDIINRCDSTKYKIFLDEYSLIQKTWQSVIISISQNIQADKAKEFVNKIFATLKDPPLPILKLRRENIGMHCNSWFQNKLAEVLWEGGQGVIGLSCFYEENPIIEISKLIKNEKEKYLDELKKFIILQKQIYPQNIQNQQQQYQNRQLLLELRWYIFSGNLHDCNKNFNQNQIQIPFLMQFMMMLYQTLRFQVRLVNQYLFEHQTVYKNAFDLVSEYNIKWNTYVASMNELDENLKLFFEIFNEGYELAMEDYPRFPKISLWRLMVKIWSQEVFKTNDLQNDLYQCFMKILFNRRNENLSFYLRQSDLDSKLKNAYYMPAQMELESISLNMQNILTKNKQFSYTVSTQLQFQNTLSQQQQQQQNPFKQQKQTILIEEEQKNEQQEKQLSLLNLKSSQDSLYKSIELKRKQSISLNNNVNTLNKNNQNYSNNYNQINQEEIQNNNNNNSKDSLFTKYEYNNHDYFNKNLYHVDSLLSNFVENILDISLNEINVHYLGHTEVQTEYPYLELEQLIIENTLDYYEYYSSEAPLFSQDNLEQLHSFFNGDFKYLKKIIKERTQNQIKTKQVQFWLSQFSTKIQNLVTKELVLGVFDTKKKKDESKMNETNAVINTELEKLNLSQIVNGQNQEENQLILEQISKQITRHLLLQEQTEKVFLSYSEVKLKSNELSVKCEQDVEIEEINNWRKLPKIMSTMEQKFYNLNGEIQIKDIEEIVKDFLKDKKNHSQQSSAESQDQEVSVYDSEHSRSDDKLTGNLSISRNKSKKSQLLQQAQQQQQMQQQQQQSSLKKSSDDLDDELGEIQLLSTKQMSMIVQKQNYSPQYNHSNNNIKFQNSISIIDQSKNKKSSDLNDTQDLDDLSDIILQRSNSCIQTFQENSNIKGINNNNNNNTLMVNKISERIAEENSELEESSNRQSIKNIQEEELQNADELFFDSVSPSLQLKRKKSSRTKSQNFFEEHKQNYQNNNNKNNFNIQPTGISIFQDISIQLSQSLKIDSNIKPEIDLQANINLNQLTQKNQINNEINSQDNNNTQIFQQILQKQLQIYLEQEHSSQSQQNQQIKLYQYGENDKSANNWEQKNSQYKNFNLQTLQEELKLKNQNDQKNSPQAFQNLKKLFTPDKNQNSQQSFSPQQEINESEVISNYQNNSGSTTQNNSIQLQKSSQIDSSELTESISPIPAQVSLKKVKSLNETISNGLTKCDIYEEIRNQFYELFYNYKIPISISSGYLLTVILFLKEKHQVSNLQTNLKQNLEIISKENIQQLQQKQQKQLQLEKDFIKFVRADLYSSGFQNEINESNFQKYIDIPLQEIKNNMNQIIQANQNSQEIFILINLLSLLLNQEYQLQLKQTSVLNFSQYMNELKQKNTEELKNKIQNDWEIKIADNSKQQLQNQQTNKIQITKDDQDQNNDSLDLEDLDDSSLTLSKQLSVIKGI